MYDVYFNGEPPSELQLSSSSLFLLISSTWFGCLRSFSVYLQSVISIKFGFVLGMKFGSVLLLQCGQCKGKAHLLALCATKLPDLNGRLVLSRCDWAQHHFGTTWCVFPPRWRRKHALMGMFWVVRQATVTYVWPAGNCRPSVRSLRSRRLHTLARLMVTSVGNFKSLMHPSNLLFSTSKHHSVPPPGKGGSPNWKNVCFDIRFLHRARAEAGDGLIISF